MDNPKTQNLESGDVIIYNKNNEHFEIKPTTKLIGLTKEQLEQYRNDPFWKTIRYALFALFWLVWVLMFVGAVLIVAISERCAKGGPKCDDNAVIYQIFTPHFADSTGDGVGDFDGIAFRLDSLKEIGATALLATPILHVSDVTAPESIDDQLEAESLFGGEKRLRNLIEAAHDHGMSFLVDLPLTIHKTNKWYNERLANESAEKEPIGNVVGDLVLLNVSNEIAFNRLVEMAIHLLRFGIDGMRITAYSLTHTVEKALPVDKLIEKLHAASREDSFIGQKNLTFFAPSKWPSRLANFTDFGLIDANEFNGENISLLEHIQKRVDLGVNLFNEQSRHSKPFWRIADLEHQRADELLASINELERRNALSSLQLLKLMLPGPASIWYGEEFGMPTNEKYNSRGLMQWNSAGKNFNFTAKTHPFDFGNSNASFIAELANANSPLNAFKNATKLRNGNEVFEKGNFTTISIDDTHLFARTLENNKAVVLVLNWPKELNSTSQIVVGELPQRVVGSSSQENVAIKAHSTIGPLPHSINLKTDNFTLNPFEAALLEF